MEQSQEQARRANYYIERGLTTHIEWRMRAETDDGNEYEYWFNPLGDLHLEVVRDLMMDDAVGSVWVRTGRSDGSQSEPVYLKTVR